MTIAINKNTQTLPLTNGQLSFWFIYQMTQETTNHCLLYEIEGELRADLLEKVLNTLIRDNEILRASISDWKAVQYIHPYEYFHLPYENLEELTEKSRKDRLATIFAEYKIPNFDLMRPPLLRACLVKTKSDSHLLMLVTPHFAMDGAALYQMDLAVRTLYDRAIDGLPLRDSPKLYLADYIAQEHRIRTLQSKQAIQFWQQQLSQTNPTYLTSEQLDITNRARRGVFIELNETQLKQISMWCSTGKLTQQMVFLGLIGKVMAKVSGNERLCITSVQENRDIEGARELYGALLTSLPIPLQLSPDMALNELFSQVKQTTLAVYEYRHVPWSVPLSLLAKGNLEKRPWWLGVAERLTGIYHVLSKQTGLYPQAFSDFATIVASELEEEKKTRMFGAHRQALTINVNMLPSFYEQQTGAEKSSKGGGSRCRFSLLRQFDFPLPADDCEWEQNVLNFYIEKHEDRGFGIRLSHQCLVPQMEQTIQKTLYELLNMPLETTYKAELEACCV